MLRYSFVICLSLFVIGTSQAADNNLLDRIDLDLLASLPTRTAAVCDCGCLDGATCTCENCPAGKAKLTPVSTPVVKTTAKRTPTVVVAPKPVVVRSPAVTYEQYSYGSCANGSCGPVRGVFRRGLFGRRR